jgi:hypothetical protein
MLWVELMWSGFVGVILTVIFFRAARVVGLTSFSPTEHLGCLITGNPRLPLTDTLGLLIFVVVGSTFLPGLVLVALRGWGGPAWIGGALVGGVLGLAIAGSLPLTGTVSACVRTGRIPPPGPFGIGWGKPTPGIIFAGHMLYGAVVAAILAGF